ncbi:hypothetical protein ACFRAQ_25115 [Nocardia sp. NPDC056611]|uniref:hypothetical protein n=1 Tax=Nocardia sp. NPDC056611 TaxID=3345877 RepID=UPI00366DEE1D
MNARNLTLATAAFARTFWAWNLIGPLPSSYTKRLDLSPGRQSLFTAVCFISIIPALRTAPAAEVRQRV